MLAEILLSRIDGIRETGPGRWLARCPAHEDRSPSLSVRETEDRLLIYCFAQCAVQDVLAAAGLELPDLFPPRESVTYNGRSRPRAKPIPARDIIVALSADLSFIAVCAADMGHGEKLDLSAMEQLNRASARFYAAAQVGGVR